MHVNESDAHISKDEYDAVNQYVHLRVKSVINKACLLSCLTCMMDEYISNVIDEHISKEMAKAPNGVESKQDFICSRVLPSIELVRQRMGSSKAHSYRANLEHLEELNLQLSENKRINNITMICYLRTVDLLASGDPIYIQGVCDSERRTIQRNRKLRQKSTLYVTHN
jgi:hypothetical protein